jgi:thymidylate kinase
MKVEVAAIVEAALAGRVPVRALRGLDADAHPRGDLDYVVPPGQARRASLLVAQAAIVRGWYVLGARDIGYVCSVALCGVGMDGDWAVKVDFVSGFAWYGMELDGQMANPFSERWRAILHSDVGNQFAGVITFFQKMMGPGSLREIDQRRVEHMGASPTYLHQFSRALALPISLFEIESGSVSSWRRWRLRAASSGLRGLSQWPRWFVMVAAAHLRFKLGFWSQTGVFIGISGIDGSGKSTVVSRLLTLYDQAAIARPQMVHFLPEWIPMPHQLFRRSKTISSYTRPYAEPPVKSSVNGAIRLTYYLIAFALASISLRTHTLRGGVVISDRSFFDFASDLTRARIPPFLLPQAVVRFMSPSGLLFLLDASPEAAVQRKNELSLDKARALQQRYRSTARAVGAAALHADSSPDDVFRSLLEHVSGEYIRRLTRLVSNGS